MWETIIELPEQDVYTYDLPWGCPCASTPWDGVQPIRDRACASTNLGRVVCSKMNVHRRIFFGHI